MLISKALPLASLALSFTLAASLSACAPSDLVDDEAVESSDMDSASDVEALSPAQVVYVNFDGVTVADCGNYCSDARVNQSFAISGHFGVSSKSFAAYSGDRATILAKLRGFYSAYNVQFTTSRPSSGNYTMVIISPSTGPNHGVAPLDCGNADPNDIAFVYKIGSASTDTIARYAAHELGHSFGLAHVNQSNDIMHWDSAGSAFRVSSVDHNANRYSGQCAGDTQDEPGMLMGELGASSGGGGGGGNGAAQSFTNDLVFNSGYYLDFYQDLRNAFGTNQTQATQHWVDNGIDEGRVANPAFYAAWYLQAYPDLKQAFGSDYRAATQHWINNGIAEGRWGSPMFNGPYYVGHYPDLQAAFGTDYRAAERHWVTQGIYEGRRASEYFDPAYYLQANPDLAQAFGATNYRAGISHWWQIGWNENRVTHP